MKNTFTKHRIVFTYLVIASLIAGTFTIINGMRLAFDGLGLGNLTYTSAELFKPIFTFRASNGAPKGHSNVAMHKGYLIVPGAPDSGVRGGGFAAFDVSNPKAPKLVISKFDATTNPMREAHGFSFSSSYAGDYVVMQTISGIIFWDWTNIAAPRVLSSLTLAGIQESDYTNGNWWVFWQAPYVYVGGSSNGIYIVDAKDPANPRLVKRIPKAQTGNYNVGSIYALGNLLISGMPESGAIGIMDISDPINPKLISNITGAVNYSIGIGGNRIFGAGDNGRLYSYDFTDPKNIRLVKQSAVMGSKGGYVSYQDGYVIFGASSNFAKVNVRNDALTEVGRGTSNISGRDEDFAMVLGNLVFAANDHAQGSALIPHSMERDLLGPKVEMINPLDKAVNQALTSRVGLSMSDNIDLRTVNTNTFIVRPVGGAALPGKYSLQFNILNFFPDVPLKLNTVYEVVVPRAGIKDISGNATATDYISTFSTGSVVTVAPTVSILPTTAQPVNRAVTLEARVTGTTTGAVTYTWNFGDGTAVSTVSTVRVNHTYTTPGHYTVKLEVKDNAGTYNASDIQTVYVPGTAVKSANTSTIIYDVATNKVWNTNPDNNTVTITDGLTHTKTKEMATGAHPRSLAKAPDGSVWVANQDAATISVFNATGTLTKTIALPYASKPYGVVFSPDKASAYVTLQATGRLLKLNPATGQIVGNISVGPHPRAIAVTSDSRKIFVTRFISPETEGEVMEVNATNFTSGNKIILAAEQTEDSESGGRGIPNYLSSITLTNDGTSAWITAKKDNTLRGKLRDGEVLTFENTVRSIISILNVTNSTESVATRIDMDSRDSPTAVAFSNLGDYAFIAMQGNNVVEVRDAYKGTLHTAIENSGEAPRGLVLSPDGNKLFIHNFMGRSVSVYNVTSLVQSESNEATKLAEVSTVATELLAADVLKGKKIFYSASAKMTQAGYISCATCHVDGGSDGRNWDFTEKGEGVRNNIQLNGRAGLGHGRVHWSANFDEIQDFENDVRLSFKGSGFGTDADFLTTAHTLGTSKKGLSPDLDALAAYITSLNVFDKSPFRTSSGELTAEAIKGKVLFEDLKCAKCHTGDDFTDSEKGYLHDVGTLAITSGGRLGMPMLGLDVPTLRDVWNTAPYLHNGSAANLYDVLVTQNKDGKHGEVSKLTRAQVDDLISYIKQIDGTEPASAVAGVNFKLSSPAANTNFTTGQEASLAVTTDMTDISEVVFYANGVEIGRSASTPYSLKWTGTPGKQYELHAKAYHGKLTTIAPEVNVTFADLGGTFFTSVTSKGTNTYRINRIITPNLVVRTDQTTFAEEVIPTFTKAEIILAPNNDRTATDPQFLTLQIAQQGMVYIGFDPRATSIPAWLEDWSETKMIFRTSDQDFVIYEKFVPAGRLLLGGNSATGSVGATSNYIIIGKPSAQPIVARITSPAEGASFTLGSAINFTTSVLNNVTDVAKVDYIVNQFNLGGSASGPTFGYSWTNAQVGHLEVIAVVTDKKGNAFMSEPVNINVTTAINLKPVVAIVTPLNKSSYTTTENIVATVKASDPENKLAKVEYFLNDKFVGSSAVSPFEVTFNASDPGSVVLTAVATDDKGLRSEVSLGVDLEIIGPLGVEDMNMETSVSLTPNPARHKVVLTADDVSKITPISIINMEGQKSTCQTTYLSGTQLEVNVSRFTPGLYLIEYYKGEKTFRKKVVIE